VSANVFQCVLPEIFRLEMSRSLWPATSQCRAQVDMTVGEWTHCVYDRSAKHQHRPRDNPAACSDHR
jgi:hypothetical protein